MSKAIVQDILNQIQQLSEEERTLLEEHLAELEEKEWQREARQARRLARRQGLDQAIIDRTIKELRYATASAPPQRTSGADCQEADRRSTPERPGSSFAHANPQNSSPRTWDYPCRTPLLRTKIKIK